MQQIKEKFSDGFSQKQLAYQQSNQSLVSFQCMICLNQFDDKAHLPIIVCINQHNLCRSCVDNKSFKKVIQANDNQNPGNLQKESVIQITYLCPLCNQQIQEKNLRNNNLLLEIYKWIAQISKRQNHKIDLFTRDLLDLQNLCQKQQTQIQQFSQNNKQLTFLTKAVVEQNKFIKEKLKIEDADKKQLSDFNQEALQQFYQQALVNLNKKIALRKLNIDNQKQLKYCTQICFQVDRLHEHFSKFTMQSHGLVSMQGPFYRSFFQSLNFYYCLPSKTGIKPSFFQQFSQTGYIYFEVEISFSSKGKIYVGLCSKETGSKINAHLEKQFIGLLIQTGELICKGKSFSKQPYGRIENRSKIRVQIGHKNIVWKVNSLQIYKCDRTIMFQSSVKDLFPVIFMQMVGDKVKVF